MSTTTPAAPQNPLRPPVPRQALTRGSKVMLGLGVLLLGGYTALAASQWEPSVVERDELPASVRSSPGGYRSYHFWHVGYHGGK